jgi:CheY-like chemotaxis protein
MLLAHRTIFIVEDNTQNRVVFKMALSRHGALVEFERWGTNSTFLLRSLPHVDLIILDLMLADGISGLDVFDEIRALPKFDQIPIIAVSAVEPAVAIPQARLRGFAGFLAKPIDAKEFPKQVAKIIEGEQIWATSGTL